jgi:raffinose/stachyose/melibiose transport system substrate-binding protein
MSLRKAIAVGTAAAVAVPLLSFSSSANASSGPSVVIWTIDQPASVQKVVDNLITQFNKTYPGGGNVSIDWEGNGEAWKTKIAVAMAAHQPPTIFYTFGGALFDQWIQAGDVANLSGVLAADPAWKSDYTARNVWALASYKGGIYAVPANGPDFEVMWENTSVLKKAGLAASPTTWSSLLSDVSKLKASGVTPITIAGNDLWPEMIWMQYLTLRIGGPGVFERINALTPGSWNNPAILAAAADVQKLAKMNAFEPGFDAVTFASGDADRLLATGQAGFEAQLYYDEANMRVYDPSFAASPDYVGFNFPAVPGGTGNPGDLVGQPAEYYGVSSYASSAAKKEALSWLKYETTSMAYNVNYLEDNGFTPITAAAANVLLSGKIADGKLLYSLYKLGTTAPYLQPYWDQDLPSAVITPMLTDIGELFTLTITPQKFVTNLDGVLASLHK